MKHIFTFMLMGLFSITGMAQQFMPLWPKGKMPNSKGMQLEHVEARQRITQVKEPGMYAYFTSTEENKGSAVLICPPGGYQKLTYHIAGHQLAKWFNTMGINAFVLIYRLPNSPDLVERELGPIQDAQRAMRLIRAHASAWGIHTDRVGIMGASAGGHLASTLGTHRTDFSALGDSLDRVAFDPNFMVLVSPVINMDKYTHKGSRKSFFGDAPSNAMVRLYSNEQQVDSLTPPTFLAHAQDDPVVPAQNSLLFYAAMIAHKVPGTLHIFPHGGHSIALRNNPGSTMLWTNLCEAWLQEIGMFDKAEHLH